MRRKLQQQLLLLSSMSLLVLLQLPPQIDSQSSLTWEQSNDPDFLCANSDGSDKYTGYKATLDCRGYVYCNDGYLMGGGISSGSNSTSGVIACQPNQLFDESLGTCTYWQNVDTNRCPDFDGSMMMPELTDANANQERFYVSYMVLF